MSDFQQQPQVPGVFIQSSGGVQWSELVQGLDICIKKKSSSVQNTIPRQASSSKVLVSG